MDKYETESDLVTRYSQNAKTYIQLSMGGLALSIVFIEDVLGSEPKVVVDLLIIAVWTCLLVAIILGVSYQYLSVRWLELIAKQEGLLFDEWKRSVFWHKAVEKCSIAYIAMLISFYIGSFMFVAFGIARLRSIVC